MYKKTCLGLFLFLCGSSLASDRIIEIDISEQRLYLYKNKSLEASYPISTSKYGEGSIENSYKTPLVSVLSAIISWRMLHISKL